MCQVPASEKTSGPQAYCLLRTATDDNNDDDVDDVAYGGDFA
jgi:hypothetical protein